MAGGVLSVNKQILRRKLESRERTGLLLKFHLEEYIWYDDEVEWESYGESLEQEVEENQIVPEM